MNPPATAAAASAIPTSPATPALARVAVLGASGYSGQAFARLALRHPGLALDALVSRDRAGEPAAHLLPGLDTRTANLPPVVDLDGLAARIQGGTVDALIACLPHGAWRTLAAERPALASAPRWIIDLSSDHRAGLAAPAGGEPYRYGLPEAFRATLSGATRVANPGCYATAAELALIPAAEAGWLGAPVMISALSGVSGAGRAATLRTSFVELDGGASLYKPGIEHAHVTEIERVLARVTKSAPPLAFAPQLVPMARGILLTAYVPLAHPVTPAAAHALYAERWTAEPFVRLLAAGEWPATRAVRGSNRCDVAVTTLHEGRTLFISSALDNLVKGAAGQALQNLNLMLGWPETTGLSQDGEPW